MIALNVEGVLHSFGRRKSRRIKEDKIIAPRPKSRLFEPFKTIRLNKLMLITGLDEVQRQICLRPFKISPRHIDGGGRNRTTIGRINRGGSGVSKQVENAFTTGFLADHLSGQPMI